MDKYTASNGAQIVLTNAGETGYVRVEHVASAYLGFEEMVAWREFFQAERDEELGRWRSPVNPHEIVYRDGDNCALVVDERTGRSEQLARWEADLLEKGAAFEYFEAHPERKPWEDAKPGEHWSLTAEGAEREYVAILSHGWDGDYVRLFPIADINAVALGAKATVITAGRRIWPESD